MRAYKFRSASQFAFVLDIILNRRLFCSDWRQQNDPMEGMFAYSYGSADEEDLSNRVAQIITQKKRLKICSLSKTFDSHLMWAHYAGGFDGVAIEVNLPEDNPYVKEVRYRGVFESVSLSAQRPPEAVANQILSSKYDAWEYEKEVRILQHDSYFHLRDPVSRVIAGHRMPPALFEGLHIICSSLGIELCRTGIGDEGIDADQVETPRKLGLTKRSSGPSRLRRAGH